MSVGLSKVVLIVRADVQLSIASLPSLAISLDSPASFAFAHRGLGKQRRLRITYGYLRTDIVISVTIALHIDIIGIYSR